jgi:hypothetical protein
LATTAIATRWLETAGLVGQAGGYRLVHGPGLTLRWTLIELHEIVDAAQHLLPEADPFLAVVVPYELPGTIAKARAEVDAEVFDRGLEEGRTWMLDQAVAIALPDAGPVASNMRSSRP